MLLYCRISGVEASEDIRLRGGWRQRAGEHRLPHLAYLANLRMPAIVLHA
jgi:hypothetical protein